MGTVKLSLCIIAGNEEGLIRRCLDTFAKGIPVDELIVVRAVGSRKPDRTLDIARDEYGAIVSEYFNAPEHADWPHVDNFGAARQKAWGLASGDVLMWVDCDDTAVPHSLKRLREYADNMPADAVLMPYTVTGQPVAHFRERLLKRGVGTWGNAVHEVCSCPDGSTYMTVKDCAILHSPGEEKGHDGSSNDRNLRILDSIKEKNSAEKFFYHLELLGAKRYEEAVKAAMHSLNDPTLCDVNRYEIFMNLNGLAKGWKEKAGLLMEAIKLCPWRREAIARMSCDAMSRGDPVDALAYARMMVALPEPEIKAAYHRLPLYGWAGKMILAQAHRLNGNHAEADRLDVSRCPRPRFSVLHATRSRPVQAAEICKLFIDRAADPESVEYIFAVDSDDKESQAILARFPLVIVPPGGGVVRAINAAANKARGAVLVMAADDCLPPPRWDFDVWEKLGAIQKPAVLAVSDGYRKDALLAHPIMNHAFYRQQGYFFCPEYPHLFCDTELTHRAHKAGQVIDGRDLVFRHNNPIFTGQQPDALAQERNSFEAYRSGSEIFKRRNPDCPIK